MEWRGRRESSNIEDRRGGGGGGGPIRIGGIGVIVVLLVGAFFGIDTSGLLDDGSGGGYQQSAGSGPNTVDDETEQFVSVVLAQTEDVWGPMFQQSGLTYTDPKLVLFSGVTRSACGAAQSAMGPFYCPNDKKVYLDTDFFRVMRQQLGGGGEFAQAYVIAHEVGHHVQDELGVLSQVNTQRGRVSEAASNALSVKVELQADCYAGLWAKQSGARGAQGLVLSDADIRSALDTAAAIGDDALQKASQGYAVPDSFTHGTSKQRQEWFYRGYKTGDPGQCDTFSAASL